MKASYLSLILLLGLSISGCSTVPVTAPKEEVALSKSQQTLLQNSAKVKSTLYQQYTQWKGTKYQIGGLSSKGIDCSGFVYVTYRDKFGIKLPRATDHQKNVGTKVSKKELKAGDLVFFMTGRSQRHVGIYLEEGKFLHASTSKGVMISRLSDYYWKDKFWQARRIGR
ncbi:NlpC/P60 family protein [Shewanella sp. AS1]|uniref:NlpC/P60 family protein n=1 Tax=Shewanella sp. AS1 TaxID=2907626 RepID=UPI001F457729|nr:NlpC/P60 family protein [Shewanella sp. AS1]MCE9679313.1 NlpC/P60 family protein [Shewanella sp. AS1]